MVKEKSMTFHVLGWSLGFRNILLGKSIEKIFPEFILLLAVRERLN